MLAPLRKMCSDGFLIEEVLSCFVPARANDWEAFSDPTLSDAGTCHGTPSCNDFRFSDGLMVFVRQLHVLSICECTASTLCVSLLLLCFYTIRLLPLLGPGCCCCCCCHNRRINLIEVEHGKLCTKTTTTSVK